MAKEKRIIRIGITKGAKQAVEDFSARYDMTEFGVASRLYERFASFPDPVQRWLVGLADGRESEGMRIFAEKLLGRRDSPESKR